ncbi:MAG: hypothetical protein K2J80_05865, partial [Oscillospiraceae bacterium]|nr:hypothetical protein [Oscillospiraceae bacterium]
MDSYSDVFNKKSDLLREKLLGKTGADGFKDFSSVCGRYAAFVSVSDINQQAYVFRASAETVGEAWENACADALEFVDSEGLNPVWVKADITFSGEKKPLDEVLRSLSKGYAKFFRKGISFDDRLDRALIEAELNVSSLIDYKAAAIDIIKLNKYLAENDLKTLSQFPENVILFTCKSAFCDEKNEVYELYSEGKDCGRRKLGRFEKDTAFRVITTAAEYLAMQIGLDGKFDYGVYPTFPRSIKGYNILRHASSIWSLLCSYRITGDKFILDQAESALGFLIRNMSYKYPNKDGKDNVLYLFEETRGEVKIGGNAIAIIVLTEYMSILNTDKYAKIAAQLGNGIL